MLCVCVSRSVCVCVSPFQLLNHVADYYETSYGGFVIGGRANAVLFRSFNQ
jgi:hypothetical protein